MATSNSYDWNLNRNQVITAALRKLSAIPSGGTPTTNQINDGVDSLNALLKAFNADGMPLWVITSKTFTVTSGTSVYEIGVGSTVNAPQPLKVIQALYTIVGSPAIRMNIYNGYDFHNLPNIDNSGTPVNLYYQPLAVTGVISVWPTPSDSTTQITIYYQRPFQDMDNDVDDLDFPSYWTQAIIYNLAWSLSPEYGIPPTDRELLMKEADYWRTYALSFGTEEGSFSISPNKEG